MDAVTGMPHDSAEGYMFEFAINLQTMNFLMGTNALDKETESRVLEYIKTCKGAFIFYKMKRVGLGGQDNWHGGKITITKINYTLGHFKSGLKAHLYTK